MKHRLAQIRDPSASQTGRLRRLAARGSTSIALAASLWLWLVAGSATSSAENSVFIDDLYQQAPGSTIEIPVHLTNDVELRQMIIPLVFRHQGGDLAFFSAAKASFRDRLPPSGPDAPLSQIQFTNRYDNEDGSCKEGSIGGFGTITYLNDTTSHPVTNAPLAFMLVRIRVVGSNLASGTDETGSIVFTLTLNEEPGCFYIDTTCTNPYNHIDFQANSNNEHIVPTFRTAQICIDGSCTSPNQPDLNADGFSDALDLAEVIDVLFAGRSDVSDVNCPSTRADFDCDKYATALDLSRLIDYLFVGGDGPCDPCAP